MVITCVFSPAPPALASRGDGHKACKVNDVLSETQIISALAELPGWSGSTDALTRTIEFSDFPTAIRAVVAVAEVAEENDHHPDMDIRWRTVVFTVATHSAGGVTGLDVELAGRISSIAASLGS
jgi:4a-hydroxytetrahydrobiopterin dehydratase